MARATVVVMSSFKKIACFVPGIGAPVSLYYFITNPRLRGAALKGIFLLLASVIILASRTTVHLPSPLIWLSTTYVYLGIYAIAAGWGFLAMLIAWRVLEKKAISMDLIPELIPSASTTEVIQDVDADSSLGK